MVLEVAKGTVAQAGTGEEVAIRAGSTGGGRPRAALTRIAAGKAQRLVSGVVAEGTGGETSAIIVDFPRRAGSAVGAHQQAVQAGRVAG
jgi:hypothetical protein